ncbi:unnamed protein product [Nyctereutes procyonoides]|uniref:(raccoon dog) hypothetical protein n=1 Tax=Nyctereutes procyonoides TaxID=34880 RepID=A0A811XUM6_NYCPR|nr:unnamed protein product [Nyctereutes procyonoides]
MPCDASAQPEGPVRARALAGGAGATGTASGALLRSCPCRGVRSLEASLQPQHFRIWPSRLVLYLIVIIISNSEPAHLTLTRHTVTQDQRGLPKTLWVSFRAQDGRWREPRWEGTRKGVISRGGGWLGWGAVPLSQPRSAPRPRSPHVPGAAPTAEKPPGMCHRRPDGAVRVPGSPDGCREQLVLRARGAESSPELPRETENARERSAKNLLLMGLMFPRDVLGTCPAGVCRRPCGSGSRALCRKGRCRCAGPREGRARRAWGGSQWPKGPSPRRRAACSCGQGRAAHRAQMPEAKRASCPFAARARQEKPGAGFLRPEDRGQRMGRAGSRARRRAQSYQWAASGQGSWSRWCHPRWPGGLLLQSPALLPRLGGRGALGSGALSGRPSQGARRVQLPQTALKPSWRGYGSHVALSHSPWVS